MVLMEKPEGKRTFGRLRHGGEDNIKILKKWDRVHSSGPE